MVNFTLKKSGWPKLPKYDPSFYRRFSRAWANFQENEVESGIRVIIADAKPEKPSLQGTF